MRRDHRFTGCGRPPRSHAIWAALLWTCLTAPRIIGVARWIDRLTRCPGPSGPVSRRAACRPARARRPGWWSCCSKSVRWPARTAQASIRNSGHGRVRVRRLFDDGAGVVGDQSAQHGIGVLGVAQVPGAVELVCRPVVARPGAQPMSCSQAAASSRYGVRALINSARPRGPGGDVLRVILTDITLERQEDGPLLQLARLALIVRSSAGAAGRWASRSVIPAWSCAWQGPAVRSGLWRPAAWASG